MNMNPKDWTDPVAVGATLLPRRMLGSITKDNTTIRTEDDWTIIRYHNTDIVKFNNAYIVLDTGGWFTVTTKSRMNQIAREFQLDFSVYSEDGGWVCNFNPDNDSMAFDHPGNVVYDFSMQYGLASYGLLVIDRKEYL